MPALALKATSSNEHGEPDPDYQMEIREAIYTRNATASSLPEIIRHRGKETNTSVSSKST